MKQYIFLLNKPLGHKEIKIEASGMLDAFKKVKEIQIKTMKETSSNIDIQFKGVLYSY